METRERLVMLFTHIRDLIDVVWLANSDDSRVVKMSLTNRDSDEALGQGTAWHFSGASLARFLFLSYVKSDLSEPSTGNP